MFSLDQQQSSTVNTDFKAIKILKEWDWLLTSLLKISVFIGALVSWSYFSFYVRVLPSFNSIGDITAYLVLICIWASLVTLLIGLFSFTPFFLVHDLSRKETNTTNKTKWIIRIFFILVPFLTVIAYSIDTLHQLINNYQQRVLLVSVSFLPAIFMFLLQYDQNNHQIKKSCKRVFSILVSFLRPTFMFLLQYDQNNHQNKKLYKSRKYIWSYLYKIIFLLVNTEKLFFLCIYACIMTFAVIICMDINSWFLLFIAFLVLINIFIITDKEYAVKKFFGIIVLMIIFFSTSMQFAKKDNIIIIAPFKMLQLGNYNAELHFKKEFIMNEKPFALNDKNLTYGVFKVLSSIGDEYIIQEIRVEEKINSHLFYKLVVGGKPYYYCDNNNSVFIKNKDNSLTKTMNFKIIEEAKKLREYNKQNVNSSYRIDKDNITFEKTGNSINWSATSWLVER